MNAKQELAGRVMQLVDDEVCPTTQRVLDILSDYTIEHNLHLQEMDFQRQVEHFLFAKKSEDAAPGTIYNYRLYLGIFGDYVGKSAGEVTTNDIRDFIAYLSSVRGNKINSIQSVLNILRSFFGWMHLEELIARDPTARIKSFRLDKKDCRHPLTHEQLELMRDACQNYRDKAVVEFLYSTGCRVSEATQIDFDKVDLMQRSVQTIGKGKKKRTLYFSVRACLMLQAYKRERGGGTALFCAERRPYDRLGSRAMQRIIRDIGLRAGIGIKVCPHMLRHTLATNMLSGGVDITIIQQVLGHSNVNTTQIYAEINQDAVQHEHRKFVA